MKKSLLQYGSIIIFVVGLLASVLLLFNSFEGTGIVSGQLEGTKVIFGGIKKVGSSEYGFKINFILLIAFAAPIAAAFIGLLKKDKLGTAITIVLFVLSIVLLVITKDTPYTLFDVVADLPIKLTALGWVSVVLSALGGLVSIGLLLEE